jgi:beta-glucosidase
MCLNPDIQRLLRDQLGWGGYIITDEGSITFAGPGYHAYTSTVTDAACLALNAGSDLALGGEFGPNLPTCLARGNVTAARIAQAATRTLSTLMATGWFDTLAARATGSPDPVPYNRVTVAGNVSTPAHRALSRAAARESFVLLKNAGGNTLPLNAAALKRVALVGPAASYSGTATSSYIGSYSGCEDGPGAALDPDPRCHVVTLLEALTNVSASAGFTLGYAPGCDVNTPNTSGIPAAVAAAAGADVIIAAVGLDTCQESYCSEGEANDRGRGADSPAPTLDFPGAQLPLLQALVAAYPRTPLILVLLNGGPVSSPWAYGAAAAVLEAWYPGYDGGGAIVDALFGAYSPAGRLPVTIVRDESETPPPTDFIMSTPPGRTHRYYTGTPLYPFGFGLSYANFSYSGLTVSPSTLGPGDGAFTVSMTVTHTGGPASDEVVEVFGAFQAPSVGVASIPRQQLLNFTRLHSLAPGSSTPVSFTIPRSALALVTPGGAMAVSPGTWALWAGGGPPSNAAYGGGAVLNGTLVVQ